MNVYKKLGIACTIGIAMVELTTAGAFSGDIPKAASDTFTNGRDLGILAGVVVAFMLSIAVIMGFESRRRQKAAELNQRALDAVSSAVQSLAVSTATSIHNMIEHNTQLNAAADTRIYEMLAFFQGRPCFMATDARDLLREATRNRRATDAAKAVNDVAKAAAVAAEGVLETARVKEEHQP